MRWPEYAAMARAAEHAGFDSIWLGDHLLYRDDGRPERGPWEAWTLLAALAAVTERVTLGTLVACAAFHPPAVLAKMAATVDEVSGGRLVLGIGAGWNRAEFDAFGLPFDHRASRFEEAFEIVRRLLGGERVTLHGSYWHVEDAVLLPVPSRRPPLMIGSTGERDPVDRAAARRHVEHVVRLVRQHAGRVRGAERRDRRGRGACRSRPSRDPTKRVRARGAGPRRRTAVRSIRAVRRSRARPNGSPRVSRRWPRPEPTR